MGQPNHGRIDWLGACLMFRPAYDCEDRLGVAEDGNHAVFKWSEADLFVSCCQKGAAISAHFATDRAGIRSLKHAIDEFCAWVFGTMSWCRMIFACIVRPSVERLVVKCGFSFLETRDGVQIYARFR